MNAYLVRHDGTVDLVIAPGFAHAIELWVEATRIADPENWTPSELDELEPDSVERIDVESIVLPERMVDDLAETGLAEGVVLIPKAVVAV